MKSKEDTGFTLIELVIAIAIVSILATIAIPSYQEHVRKTKRAECAGGLMGLANAMERFFTRTGTYAGTSGLLGTAAGDIYIDQCPIDGGTATYTLSIPAATLTPTSYVIQAAPAGAQTGDKCGTLTLTNTGTKGITGATAGVTVQDCW